jgi:hypothetical protein
MTAREFWGATWREIMARRRAYDRAQEPVRNHIAVILAALYNGPLVRNDKQMWTASMFLPDYQPTPPVFDWQRDYEATAAALPRKPDARKKGIERDIAFRMQRAAAAHANGATGEQVQAIMRGVL